MNLNSSISKRVCLEKLCCDNINTMSLSKEQIDDIQRVETI